HAESLAGYTLSSVTYGSVDVTSAVNASTYAVTNTAFSGATLGEQAAIKLTFVNPSDETDKWHVSGTAMVVTQALRNADDITGFMDVAYVGEKTAASVTLWGETYTNVKYGSWDGYFALANDIDYGGAEYLARMDYNNWVATYGNDYLWGCGRDQNAHTSDLDGIGFCGTFDGQGYTITKLCVGGTGRVSGGFIGTLNTRGVIKNVAFTQAKHYGWGSFLVANGNGTIEDMYIQADWQNPGDSYNPSAWIYSKDCMADARVRRVVINIADYSKDDTSNMYSIGKAHLNYGILNGVYSIGGPSQSVGVLSTGTGAADVYGAYADEATFKSSVDISSWTASVWTTGAGSAVK
ncbi:MAG: hypothetical protein IJV80_01380, partial [Clostridia bacterium]|nr:hypothetical protein [Clostridia bacterium]